MLYKKLKMVKYSRKCNLFHPDLASRWQHN